MIASPLAALHCNFDAGLWLNSGCIKSFPLLILEVGCETIIAGDQLDAGSLSWEVVFLPADKLSLLPLCETCLHLKQFTRGKFLRDDLRSRSLPFAEILNTVTWSEVILPLYTLCLRCLLLLRLRGDKWLATILFFSDST